jgi:hypothetical protein
MTPPGNSNRFSDIPSQQPTRQLVGSSVLHALPLMAQKPWLLCHQWCTTVILQGIRSENMCSALERDQVQADPPVNESKERQPQLEVCQDLESQHYLLFLVGSLQDPSQLAHKISSNAGHDEGAMMKLAYQGLKVFIAARLSNRNGNDGGCPGRVFFHGQADLEASGVDEPTQHLNEELLSSSEFVSCYQLAS